MIKNDLFIADHRVGLAVDHPVGGLGEILGAEDGTADSPGFEKFPGKITFLHGDGFALEIREGGDTGLFRPDKNRSRHLEQRPGKRKPRDPLFTVKQHSHYTTVREAGRGAVREACEFLMRAQGTLDDALAPYLK